MESYGASSRCSSHVDRFDLIQSTFSVEAEVFTGENGLEGIRNAVI
jgi:hypothetical protein